MEHARDETAGARDQEPAGLHGQAGGPAIGRQGVEQRLDLAPEVGGRGDRARVPDRKAAADVERVEALPARADEREQRQAPAHGVAPRVDRPELGADVEVDAARPEWTVGRDLGDDVGQCLFSGRMRRVVQSQHRSAAVVIADDTSEHHHRARRVMRDEDFVFGGINGLIGERSPHDGGHRA